MKNVGLILAALVVLAAPAARAQLSGEDRVLFLKGFNRTCLKSLHEDERFSGVSRSFFTTVCGCSARRIADRIDPDDYLQERYRPAEEREAWVNDLQVEAIDYCANRHGGYIAGMTVTPNK